MNFYIKLAKKAVENYIKFGKVIKLPGGIPENILEKKAPTFITIKKNNNFRSCIGTVKPTKKNLLYEIIYNSISAATNDYRLGPIKVEELPLLTYEVYILGKPEVTKNINELNPKKYGVIAKDKKNRTGVLLPDLEGVDTKKEQLSIALLKANITCVENTNELFKDVLVYRFKVKKYS